MVRYERMLSFVFGASFCCITLVLSIFAQNPSDLTRFVLRASLSLGAAGVAVLLFRQTHFSSHKITVGSAAVMFFTIYLVNPPQLIQDRLDKQSNRLIEEGAYLINRGNVSDGVEKIRQAQGLGVDFVDIPYYLCIFEEGKGDYIRALHYATLALTYINSGKSNVTKITAPAILLERSGLNEELGRLPEAYADAKAANQYSTNSEFLRKQSAFTRGRLALTLGINGDSTTKLGYVTEAAEQLGWLSSNGWPTAWSEIWGPFLLACAQRESAAGEVDSVKIAQMNESQKNIDIFKSYTSTLAGERKMEVQLILSIMYKTNFPLPAGYPIRCTLPSLKEFPFASYRPYSQRVVSATEDGRIATALSK